MRSDCSQVRGDRSQVRGDRSQVRCGRGRGRVARIGGQMCSHGGQVRGDRCKVLSGSRFGLKKIVLARLWRVALRRHAGLTG
jgi:hypothetical protein